MSQAHNKDEVNMVWQLFLVALMASLDDCFHVILLENLSLDSSARQDSNQPVHPQCIARGLKC